MPLRVCGRAQARWVARTRTPEREEEAARASCGHWKRAALEAPNLLVKGLGNLSEWSGRTDFETLTPMEHIGSQKILGYD
ncbi:hypothetical protein NDU88_004415 [Pleurodeles waltl]|uniref:Uncharacterized protein n=1 Tax=Pleurodeles waltl TaxID=8319 RepID=A0AAV7VIL6_PLEWA|nr:hypothetical protein NDU88_004415 [Pleurodeles waltl]